MFKKSALIFGASSEIGQWIIESLYQQRTYPVLLSRHDSDFQINFSDYYDVLKILQYYVAKHSDITSVYFCIGKYTRSELCTSSPYQWMDDISVNLGYAYICYRALCEVFKDSTSEIRLVFLGSTASISRPSEFSSYVVSKSALEVLINYINNELPENFRACCLRLGTCNTRFSNSQSNTHTIQADDIIQTVHFLETISFHAFPDLISLRPIRSMEK